MHAQYIAAHKRSCLTRSRLPLRLTRSSLDWMLHANGGGGGGGGLDSNGSPGGSLPGMDNSSQSTSTIQELINATGSSWQLAAQALDACGNDAQRCART